MQEIKFKPFNSKEFGQKIKSARVREGITQEDFAERLDISKRTLLEIEAGRADMQVTKIFIAAEELKLTVNFLLGLPEQNIVNSFNQIQQEAYAQQGLNPQNISIDRDWQQEVNRRFTFMEEQLKKKD